MNATPALVSISARSLDRPSLAAALDALAHQTYPDARNSTHNRPNLRMLDSVTR